MRRMKKKMIVIEDNDFPVDVACKIIKGIKKNEPTPLMRSFVKDLTGKDCADEVDMFSLEEIKEIAEYLMVYCKSHKEEGD
jgi:formylmethanofuran dehydrogenase subunit B